MAVSMGAEQRCPLSRTLPKARRERPIANSSYTASSSSSNNSSSSGSSGLRMAALDPPSSSRSLALARLCPVRRRRPAR